jgi:hypothetical protein
VVKIDLPKDADLLEEGQVVEVPLELDRQNSGIVIPPVVGVYPEVVTGVDPVVVRCETTLSLAEQAAPVLET